jgi:hypothetical protein
VNFQLIHIPQLQIIPNVCHVSRNITIAGSAERKNSVGLLSCSTTSTYPPSVTASSKYRAVESFTPSEIIKVDQSMAPHQIVYWLSFVCVKPISVCTATATDRQLRNSTSILSIVYASAHSMLQFPESISGRL